jgi:hypothetical protein
MNRRDFTLGLGAVAAAAAGGVTAAKRPWTAYTFNSTYEVPTGFTVWRVDDVVGLTVDCDTVSIYKNGEYLTTVKQERSNEPT